jgi:hypothetical protein
MFQYAGLPVEYAVQTHSRAEALYPRMVSAVVPQSVLEAEIGVFVGPSVTMGVESWEVGL